MSTQVTYHRSARSAADAVAQAKEAARAEGHHILTVAKVMYAPVDGSPAWKVTLAVRVTA